jgi:DNA-binding CsgD family transcriptional regulator
VDGVVTGSRESLAAAEAMFASMGADLPAAEAAAALAVELHRVRRPREAAAATGRSTGHQRRCEGAATPMLLRRADSASLTPREREAALLAARGMATKAIARDLGVSERTVSNHLQNAYVKLGISTRADLADALGL